MLLDTTESQRQIKIVSVKQIDKSREIQFPLITIVSTRKSNTFRSAINEINPRED